jgi:protein-S-isoprenylcysteine O-methyltransferase Ste14
MPEARKLVTQGPYAYARHPLYTMEMVTVAGSAMLFQQPWAGLLAIGVFILLAVRSYFEERVLMEAYPEYRAYCARVKRFGFI